ncbi:MAG: DUF2621 family protein [Chloroflexi bacterium]|nr:DUF2621 family protein [Chloroflexota bacterium]
MNWSGEAEQTLDAFCAMVPEVMRDLARASAHDEGEQLASERGAEEVESDDVVRGWIRTTPPEQRNSLVAVIEDLGFDPEPFADDLQSDEGWGEGDDELS